MREILKKQLVKQLVKSQDNLVKEFGFDKTQGALLIKADKEGLRPLLTCHLDTINDHYYIGKIKGSYFDITDTQISVNKNAPIRCLGTDDRAGLTLALELLKNNNFDLLVTTDEEIGGVGVGNWVDKNPEIMKKNEWSCVISLDRRVTELDKNEVALYGYNNKDLVELFEKKGYQSYFGSYTDGVDIARATGLGMLNISVGYKNEHTQNELLIWDRLLDTFKLLNDKEFMETLSNKKYLSDENCSTDDFMWDDDFDWDDEVEYDDYYKELEEYYASIGEIPTADVGVE